MAAQLQTALKNNLLSAYNSAKNIPGESFQIEFIKMAIAIISNSERELGLTPVNPTATLIVRTESELIAYLETQAATLATLAVDADWTDAASILIVALSMLFGVVETYRIFVN